MAKVLVVEDDPAVREVASRILMAAGQQVETMATGEGVVERVQAHRPDVVLLDLVLPQVSGLDVLRGLMELASPPGVVVMTGWQSDGEESRIEAALALGADEALTKPFLPEDLLEALRASIEARGG